MTIDYETGEVNPPSYRLIFGQGQPPKVNFTDDSEKFRAVEPYPQTKIPYAFWQYFYPAADLKETIHRHGLYIQGLFWSKDAHRGVFTDRSRDLLEFVKAETPICEETYISQLTRTAKKFIFCGSDVERVFRAYQEARNLREMPIQVSDSLLYEVIEEAQLGEFRASKKGLVFNPKHEFSFSPYVKNIMQNTSIGAQNKEKIQALANEGYTQEQIQLLTGLGRTTVQKWSKGLTKGNAKEQNAKKVLEWFKTNPNGSKTACAKELELTRQTVYNALKKNGL